MSGGYFLAHRALQPVDEMTQTARQITADRLNKRIDVQNTGDELDRLGQTFNEMFSRLERSFIEIRRFTADASHELRTPLTAIRTEVEVALARSECTPEQQQLLGSVLEECDRLARLTDQLLMLSRQDAGLAPQVREPVPLSALVKDVVETMRLLAETKGLRLLIVESAPVSVRGDDAQLRQVFFNVIDNAIKYTPAGGRIEVRIETLPGKARVIVKDSGIGIAAEHLPRVFDRFFRVDKARSREQGGTGLGLSIASSIIAAHGGQIELLSTFNEGTTCIITLPVELAVSA
jgi:heavy metal sensor kinase